MLQDVHLLLGKFHFALGHWESEAEWFLGVVHISMPGLLRRAAAWALTMTNDTQRSPTSVDGGLALQA